jgi:predicted deacylase
VERPLTVVLALPDLSAWRAGNTGVEGVWQFKSGAPGRHVLLCAIMHGNELCGAWALKDLLDSGIAPARGTLTVAFCNLSAFDRFNSDDVDASRFVEQDMNRVWDDAVLSAGETLEARRAAALAPFVRQADWVLDLHSMHEPSPPLLLCGMQERNLELGAKMGSPQHLMVDAGHSNGVRMRDYGDFGLLDDQRTRSLLIECGLHTDPASHLVARDSVLRFLRASEVLAADAIQSLASGWLQPDPPSQSILRVTEAVVASGSDFKFARHFKGLEMVPEARTTIGWNNGVEVVTPYPNCVLVMPSTRQARPGVTVVRFATQDAPRHRANMAS